MPTYIAPGVYVQEVSVVPPTVEDAETALPAFIGYTQKAGKDLELLLKPTRVSSVAEYEAHFGPSAPVPVALTVADTPGGGFKVVDYAQGTAYLLHASVQMFFANGGRHCLIIPVGCHQASPVFTLEGPGGPDGLSPEARHGLLDGLKVLDPEDGASLVLIPEAVHLPPADHAHLVQATLARCAELDDRFAVLDVQGGERSSGFDLTQARSQFGSLGTQQLRYGAAYYPFIQTTLPLPRLKDGSPILLTYQDTTAPLGSQPRHTPGLVRFVMDALKQRLLVLPPSGAVAGVYAAVDSQRGVWKAPANEALAQVVKPVVAVDDQFQGQLNVDTVEGKSINALRSFVGKGTRIWGARTLAGNDNEWRYVPVMRLALQLKTSLKRATAWTVFESNDANTWAKVRTQVEQYLLEKWRQGALLGSRPQEGYYVRCGLGETMTAQDLTAGRLVIELGFAPIRPAEFLLLRIGHTTASAP
ncbi:MAG: phage tail sheath C-terminal domain-containing protein [Pseudomonadota bacterium]